jgi:arabinan endo-1,5-alpha-L-arabinosidase
MKSSQIQIRDPFVLPVPESGFYYLFGTTDKNPWEGPGEGFDCYRSRDLEQWEGPIPAFRPQAGFWGATHFWAPEVHPFDGRFFMFASFKAPHRYRATQILVADRPEGPYAIWSEEPVTPSDWECLDGTLHLDEEGQPWIVFCHEWVQVHNGAIYARKLAPDLKRALGRPIFLFSASEAPWVKRSFWADPGHAKPFPVYVTDGPFLHRTEAGSLLMLWSSSGENGYTLGVARSESGRVEGPWSQQSEPLWSDDGGHGMIFRSFDGQLWMTLHGPNITPQERPLFIPIRELPDGLALSWV